MFEPAKVVRWRPLGDELMLDTVPGNEDAPPNSEFVLASDYDQLLELYRKAMGFQVGPPYMRPKIHDPQTP